MAPAKKWAGVATLMGMAFAQENKLCSWSQARAGTVRGALYLDGGSMNTNFWQNGAWLASGTPVTVQAPAGSLYKFSYSSSFDTNSTNYTEIFEPVNLTAVGPYNAPNHLDGAMFVDDYEFYTYGGLISGQYHNDFDLNYRLYENEEAKLFQAGPNITYIIQGAPRHITHGADASIPSESLAFYFGGYRFANDTAISQAGSAGLPTPDQLSDIIVRADMSDHGNAKWSYSMIPTTIERRASGKLVWLPVANQGLLVAIGGVVYPQDLASGSGLNATQKAVNSDKSQNFMTIIQVYDIYGDNWYQQQTSGTPPPPLMQFCAVVAAQADRSSFEIFVYGGYNGQSGNDMTPPSDEVWILSIPSFVWVKADAGKKGHGRSGHVCSTPYPNLMLVVGGEDLSGSICLEDGALFDVFDLNNLRWTWKYDSSLGQNYSTPSILTDPSAKATSMPSNLSALFDIPYRKSIQTWYPYNSTGKRSHTWRIPVIVAVVVILVLIVTGCLWWYCRSAKRRQRMQSITASDATYQNNGIRGWLGGVPKEASVTTTEIGDDGFPFGGRPAEAYGDIHFRRSLAEASAEASVSRSPYSSPLLPHSLRSPRSETAEVDGEPVHEMYVAQRNPGIKASPAHLYLDKQDFRSHPYHPPSIDGNFAHVDSYSSSSMQFSRSNGIADILGGSPRHISASPIALPTQILDEDSDLDHLQSKEINDVPVRPLQNRNPSSQSAISPPALSDEDKSGSAFMLANSGPVSPELDRPTHKRNTSSLSTNIPQLPSPGLEEDRRQSQVIGSLPERREGTVTRKPVGTGNGSGHEALAMGLGIGVVRRASKKSAYVENLENLSQTY